jgi:nitrous-oxide reductase
MRTMFGMNNTHTATSTIEKEVTVLDVSELKDICYMIPCPKSPHGCDVDPTGEYIVGSGKLAAVFLFSVLIKFRKP